METKLNLNSCWKNISTIHIEDKHGVSEQINEYKRQLEKEKAEIDAKVNKFKLFLLKNYLSIRGWFKSLKFKKNATYVGGRFKHASIYVGNNTFYEQISINEPGFCYYNNKPIKYKYWEIGMFNWIRQEVKIVKDI